jgi:hypothetical protein
MVVVELQASRTERLGDRLEWRVGIVQTRGYCRSSATRQLRLAAAVVSPTYHPRQVHGPLTSMGDERDNRLWRESCSDTTEASITILTEVAVILPITLDEEAQAKGKVQVVIFVRPLICV